MANANRLLDIQIKKIKTVINRGCKEVLAKEIKDKLIEKIFSNFYDRYGVGDTGWLIDSLAVKVEPKDNLSNFEVWVYWKDKPLSHTTWWGDSNLGISAGDKVFTVNWINSGYTFLPNDNRRINDIGEVEFIEDTISELQFNRIWVDRFYNYLRENGIDIE